MEKTLMGKCWWKRVVPDIIPHVLMILSSLAVAVFLLLLQATVSHVGRSSGPVIIVFSQRLLSTLLLLPLAFFCDRHKRPRFSFPLFCWAFLLGFLQISLSEILLTSSLRFVPATFQTTIMNTCSAVVFVLAVVFKRESFQFCSVKGQAKLWGLVLSVIGATIIVLWPGPELHGPTRLGVTRTHSNWTIGCLMAIFAVMATSSSALLVEHVATKYDSDMSLAAMTSLSGAIQSGIIAVLTERRSGSAWLVIFHGGLETITILYGGLVTGLLFYVQTWCVHKRGPVFASAFSPLLIVFSFLLETLVFGTYARAGSIFGSFFVVLGLYLLLWGKAGSNEEGSNCDQSYSIEESYSMIMPNYESTSGFNYPLISYISGFPIVMM